ncbi:MAG: anaerobic ribonucleoside-triphosphate reductase [Candidatus Ratteibacteria bacterium]|nr:anaerobic ribonucleoside-triphosphate reductase [Candidatus Ratteibacteria bacterium]
MESIATIAPSSAQFQVGVQRSTVEPKIIQVLTVEQFAEKCLRFNEAHMGLVSLNIEKGTDCPVHIYAEETGSKSCKTTVSGIKTCPICKMPMCPCCGNHSVEQLSRVTGYIQAVSGWNSGKVQELEDRQRYHIGVGGSTQNTNR